MRPRNTAVTLVFGALAGVLLALLALQSVTVAAAPDRRAEELILQGNVIPPDVLEYGKR
jgi:hypothetical protein